MDFDRAFKLLIDSEGGFDKDPRDSGNWTSGKIGVGILKGTKFGVDSASYPDLDIENLTLAEAKEIYRRDYWNKLHLDEIPEGVRFDLFDAAVNSGVRNAARFLQRAVKVFDDGDIGPATIAAANSMTGDQLDKRLSGVRLLFLTQCKAWPTYGHGWVNRIANNLLND